MKAFNDMTNDEQEEFLSQVTDEFRAFRDKYQFSNIEMALLLKRIQLEDEYNRLKVDKFLKEIENS